MRKIILILMLFVLTVCLAQASTFHGDDQRTGNFTASVEVLPSLNWTAELTGLVDSSPVYYNGHIYVTNWYGWGTWQPGLYSLNATTGAVEWKNDSITGASSVAVFGDKLVVGSLSGTLYYVNITSGKIVKSVKLESSPSWWGIASSPLVYNGSVYVTTFSNGTLWKLDADGNVLWHYTSGGEITPYSSPSAYNGLIFFAGNESGKHVLIAINESGDIQWKFPVDGKITNSPSVGDGKVFIATKSKLYAINFDESEAWNVSFNGTISTAAIAYGNIYIGSSDGKLYCFDSNTGNKKWEFDAGGKIDSSPAVANGVVYFATNTPHGTLYAVNAFTGELLWYYRLTPPSGSYYNIMSSPFIANNRLFIGADSGYVYCFKSGVVEVNVTLYPGKYTERAGTGSYEVNSTSALAALHYASLGGISDGAEIGFNYSINDSSYTQDGSLNVSAIMGLQNDGLKWRYWVNDVSPAVSPNKYELSNGDTIYYIFGTDTPPNAQIMLKINAKVMPAGVNAITVSNGARGGNITSWVNVTSTTSGWFVIVVSGTNDNGEAIAGISTVRLNANEETRVPVLIHVPQLAETGTYTLYAGVYRFEDYPNNPLVISSPVSSEVS
ncbi:outer membrane protein assembly factor BamB family protein [Archaeoglobus neptunius]|uniref:outer membrane protein assembly factor BamB family protein n=1 Tax=Archaeoglobus neptunius TaxID=2798580 RepID=UPI001927FA9A|nr:PQQ-binding-like beta-propeller repeat protein [Archaeoglobus neptunius]